MAAVKAQIRGIVHETFRVSAIYQSPKAFESPVPITLRWHRKIKVEGDLDNSGYAEMLGDVSRIIFNRPELSTANAGLPLTLEHLGVVTITDQGYDNARFTLDVMEDHDGPVDEVWHVSRISDGKHNH